MNASQRIPVTIVTGFLGAGKTTLMRQLLADPQGKRIAFVLNEIDQPGIDVDIPPVTAFIELNQGCVCCMLNTDLIETMQAIVDRGHINHVIIETTGLANPLALMWTLEKPELSQSLRIDMVVALVDILAYGQVRGTPEWESQIQAADLLLLAKTDVAPSEQIDRAKYDLAQINGQARMLDRHQPGLNEIILEELQFQDEEKGRNHVGHVHAIHSDFVAITLASQEIFSLNRLEDWLEGLAESVFRAKGIIHTAGEEGWVAFHLVAGRLQVEFNKLPPVHEETRMALFGRSLDREFYLRQLRELAVAYFSS